MRSLAIIWLTALLVAHVSVTYMSRSIDSMVAAAHIVQSEPKTAPGASVKLTVDATGYDSPSEALQPVYGINLYQKANNAL